jgi:ubiquinol-cytochrome c reductase cytochrome b subunit
MLHKVWNWIEDRTGLPSTIGHFLDEDIPASSGWHQVFGSVAAFLLLLQIFTGVLLALNYAPTPGEAYQSLRYILLEVAGGQTIRGLHHYGASLMIIIVVLHMVQVFLWGAYKKPREATWIIGVFLLLLTLGFGLTGYLLPWDNRAYWGTVVTTQIAGTAPVVGELAKDLMGATDTVGAVTFSRFYIVHVLVLPLFTLGLVGLHVYLVRRHGVAPQVGDESSPPKKFYPGQVWKDSLAIFAAFALLYCLATFARVPLERMADPTDLSYIPRPEWYFLFLFQLLKYFEGPLEVIGTVVLPGLATLALLAAPFLDREKVVPLAKRSVALAVAALAVIGWGGLTWMAAQSTPKPQTKLTVDYAEPTPWLSLSADEVASVGYFRDANCAKCHNASSRPLVRGAAKERDELVEHFRKQAKVDQLKEFQLNSLANACRDTDPKFFQALTHTPDLAVRGATIFHTKRCSACHVINSTGNSVGPPLNGLSRRRKADFVASLIRNPQQATPGSTMPPSNLTDLEMDALLAYLFALEP